MKKTRYPAPVSHLTLMGPFSRPTNPATRPPAGPAVSITDLDPVAHSCLGDEETWSRRFRFELELSALSDSDAEILDQVWARFGQFDQRQLVEYTRTHCPEWRDPGDSIIAIEMRDLFLAFGMDGETATAAAEIQEERKAMAPFKWRRQRADLRAFDAIMRRKGGEAPRTGDEIIRADGAPPWR